MRPTSLIASFIPILIVVNCLAQGPLAPSITYNTKTHQGYWINFLAGSFRKIHLEKFDSSLNVLLRKDEHVIVTGHDNQVSAFNFIPQAHLLISRVISDSSFYDNYYGVIVNPGTLTFSAAKYLYSIDRHDVFDDYDVVQCATSPDSSRIAFVGLQQARGPRKRRLWVKIFDRDLNLVSSGGMNFIGEKANDGQDNIAVNNNGEVFIAIKRWNSTVKKWESAVDIFDPLSKSLQEVNVNLSMPITVSMFITESGVNLAGFYSDSDNWESKPYTGVFVAEVNRGLLAVTSLKMEPLPSSVEATYTSSLWRTIHYYKDGTRLRYPGGYILTTRQRADEVVYVNYSRNKFGGTFYTRTHYQKPFIANISKDDGAVLFSANSDQSMPTRLEHEDPSQYGYYASYDPITRYTYMVFNDIDKQNLFKRKLMVLVMDERGSESYQPAKTTTINTKYKWLPSTAQSISPTALLMFGKKRNKLVLGKVWVK